MPVSAKDMDVDQFLDGGFLAAADSPDEQPASSSDSELPDDASGDVQEDAEGGMRKANGSHITALQEPSSGGKSYTSSSTVHTSASATTPSLRFVGPLHAGRGAADVE